MWDPWRRKPLVLAQFIVMVLTITSSIVTMTSVVVGGTPPPPMTAATVDRGGADPQTTMSSIPKVLRSGGGGVGGGRGGSSTVPLLAAGAPSLSSTTSLSSLLFSSAITVEHQRSASSSGKGATMTALEFTSLGDSDYVINQSKSSLSAPSPATPSLSSSTSHREADALTYGHQNRRRQRLQRSDTKPSWRTNEHSSLPSSAALKALDLHSDSINLSWSVLNNASEAAAAEGTEVIGHRHATVPESAGSSGPTNVNITRSNNSINSKDDSASSKVIESIRRRQSSSKDDSNRDNGDAFHGISNGPASALNDNDAERMAEAGAAGSVSTAGDGKWTEESGASTSRRRASHTVAASATVRNNRTTSSSVSRAVPDGDEEEEERIDEAVATRQIDDDSSIALLSESLLTPAALVMSGDGDNDDDSGDGGGDSQATNRNTINGDPGRNRTEVRRPNNGTTAANAKLIAAGVAATKSPHHHNGKTFVHNNITRAGGATSSALISTKVNVEDGQNSISATTVVAGAAPTTATQHRHSAVLVGGGAGGGGGAATRNKSATHNSIRTLNHISERKPYFGKHHHNNDKYGPHFEDIKTVGNVTNMTVQMGQSVYLNCRISLLQDKTVSWMRRLVGENELQLLTVGNHTYSVDSRYAVHFQYPNNWRLKITKPQVTDEGTYACQISTHPPRIIQYNLHINAPQVMIIDEAGQPLQDKYYEVDSTIQLSCIVRDVKMATSVVYWNHSDQILNYDITRGGISVKTDLMGNGANSTILVARVNKSDSGNYSCSISPDQFYTVTVHVLNGESYAELHHGNGTTLHCWPSGCLLWAYGLLLMLLHLLINPHDYDWNINR